MRFFFSFFNKSRSATLIIIHSKISLVSLVSYAASSPDVELGALGKCRCLLREHNSIRWGWG